VQYVYYIHELEKINYHHHVSTPQTDVFHLTVILYNIVVEIIHFCLQFPHFETLNL
jgi:hypothetical protein